MSHPDSEIVEQHRAQMNALARGIDEIFNGELKGPARRVGFVLLVFDYGEASGSRCNYISNGADRKDMASLFREMAARMEGQPEVPASRA